MRQKNNTVIHGPPLAVMHALLKCLTFILSPPLSSLPSFFSLHVTIQRLFRLEFSIQWVLSPRTAEGFPPQKHLCLLFPRSCSEQYHVVGWGESWQSQSTRRKKGGCFLLLFGCDAGAKPMHGDDRRRQEKTHPGLWEVHQNSHCSSSSSCRQS